MASKSRHPEVQAKATLPAVRGIDLLRARYAVGEHLRANAQVDSKQVESWVRATSETLQRVFGEDTVAAEFSTTEASEAGGDAADENQTRFRLEARLTVLEGLILRAEELYAEPLATIRAAPKRVLLTRGRDQTTSQAVLEFLESIECIPIVCGRDGEPDGAIEALDGHADVGFAIVMLTSDAGAGGANEGLLELGFLLGKLGRGRVCVVESGAMSARSYDESVLSVELDERGEWQDRLVKALGDAGIT